MCMSSLRFHFSLGIVLHSKRVEEVVESKVATIIWAYMIKQGTVANVTLI